MALPASSARSRRTGLGRLGISRDVAERCLNHVKPPLERVYAVHDYAADQREAWRRWGEHFAPLVIRQTFSEALQ